MRRRHAVAAVAAAVLAASITPVHGQGPHTLSIRVSNGTEGAAVPEGFEVSVVQFGQDGERLRRVTQRASSGVARLAFPAEPGARYLVSATYLGVTYSVEAVTPSDTGYSAALTIHETTDDPSVISVASDTLTVVEGVEGSLEVFQIFQVRNDSDRTFVGREQGRVVEMPLPAGARDFAAIEGIFGQPVAGGAGFFTSDPFLPGRRPVSYLYKIDVPRSGWTLDKPVLYPTERVDVLVGEELELRSAAVAFEEEVTLEEHTYRRYRARELGAGSTLGGAIGFEGSGANTPLLVGLIAGLAVLVAAITMIPASRRRRPAPSASEREALVEEIARLDEDFEAGEVSGDDYRRRRARLKGELAARTRDITAG